MTAKNPAGPWLDPVWLKDAPGIDPSLFFDEDVCYYTGNRWDFKNAWPAQCAVWMQELDLQKDVWLENEKHWPMVMRLMQSTPKGLIYTK